MKLKGVYNKYTLITIVMLENITYFFRYTIFLRDGDGLAMGDFYRDDLLCNAANCPCKTRII